MHICTKRTLKGCNWAAFDLQFFLLHSWSDVSSLLLLQRWEAVCRGSVGYWNEGRSIVTDVVWMMYCTTEKPKHSVAQQQKWHLSSSASLPLNASCIRTLLRRGEGFLSRCNAFFGSNVFSVLHSWLVQLSNSPRPTKYFVNWCPVVLAWKLSWLPGNLVVCHVQHFF